MLQDLYEEETKKENPDPDLLIRIKAGLPISLGSSLTSPALKIYDTKEIKELLDRLITIKKVLGAFNTKIAQLNERKAELEKVLVACQV
jgi:hypothetical protein